MLLLWQQEEHLAYKNKISRKFNKKLNALYVAKCKCLFIKEQECFLEHGVVVNILMCSVHNSECFDFCCI